MTRLTKSMERQWREVGYLHLRNGILRDEVEAYLATADELLVRHEKDHPQDREKGNYVITGTLFQTAELDPLVDHPNLIGLILDLMDPYLQVMGSEVYVRYPDDKRHGWHIDTGRSLGQIRVTPESLPLNFKIQVFLTDIPKEDQANFCFVPGSHHRQMPGKEERRLGSNFGTGPNLHWKPCR